MFCRNYNKGLASLAKGCDFSSHHIWPCGHFPKCVVFSFCRSWMSERLEITARQVPSSGVLSFGSCIILAMWKRGTGFFRWTGGDGNISAQLHFSMGSQLPGGYKEMLQLTHPSLLSIRGWVLVSGLRCILTLQVFTHISLYTQKPGTHCLCSFFPFLS